MTDQQSTKQTIDTAKLTQLDMAKFLKVMGTMPYGAMAYWGGRAPETVNDLIEVLISLSAVLDGVARRNEETRKELDHMKRLVDAGGDLISMMLRSAKEREGNA